MTPWEVVIARRKKNLGFLTRLDAFDEPTEAQKAIALEIERAHWDATRTSWKENDGKGITTFKASAEYSTPVGHGINLKRTREPGGKLDGPEYTKAVQAYVATPMDHYGILKAQGIDVTRFTRPATWIEKLFGYFDKAIEPEPGKRFTDQFIKDMQDTFKIKEKK